MEINAKTYDCMEDIKKILIINLGGIGDVLLSTPALRAVRDKYKDARIFFLGIPRTMEFIEKLSYIDTAHCLYLKPGGMLKNISTLLKLRAEKIDLAVNMRTIVSLTSAVKVLLLFKAIAPRLSAGRNTDGRGWFFDIKIPCKLVGEKYDMEYDLELAEKIGCKIKSREIDFPVNIDAANNILFESGISNEEVLIGVHPGGLPSRRWPAENFIRLIENLKKRGNYRFLITGNAAEAELAGYISSQTGSINLSGRLNLFELGALIKRCRVFITNDTGPMHIAAVLKTPLVAIFGPGDLTRFDPRNISSCAAVLYKKTDCSPCNYFTCKKMSCLRAITVAEVEEAVIGVGKL